jgi:anti-sigma factor RsiW
MIDDELACRVVVEIVTEYLEGTLPADLRARFDVHLADCQGCTTYLDQMRATIRMLRDRPSTPIDRATREDLLRMFGDWREGTPG